MPERRNRAKGEVKSKSPMKMREVLSVGKILTMMRTLIRKDRVTAWNSKDDM